MKPWTMKEVQYLIDNYPTMTSRNIAKQLGRTLKAVQGKARELGLRKQRKLKQYAVYKNGEIIAMGTAQEIATELGVTKEHIYRLTTPSFVKRAENSKDPENATTAVKL